MHYCFYISTFSSLCPFQFSLLFSPGGLLLLISLITPSLFCSWRVLKEPTEHWRHSLFLQENPSPWVMSAHPEIFSPSVTESAPLPPSSPTQVSPDQWGWGCSSPPQTEVCSTRVWSQSLPTWKFWKSGKILIMKLSPECELHGKDASDPL